jgi:predicted nucleic acid binding AN1-type Zn finger protein
MCTCIYCVLYCLIYVHVFLVVLSVLSLSDNPVAVSISSSSSSSSSSNQTDTEVTANRPDMWGNRLSVFIVQCVGEQTVCVHSAVCGGTDCVCS